MEYINEHTLPGQIGQLAIVISFVTALLAAFSYYMTASGREQWKSLARGSFYVHVAAVVGIIAALYYIMFNHYYEYQYVWQHTANELPIYYMISSLWEGQEGSFLLWIFFQAILGVIIVRTAKKWEAPSMTMFALVQGFLTSMLLGVYIFGAKVGSTPFILIRELPEYINLPFTKMPNYLEMEQFQNGRGLNPLLQNYWMVIHPPTLFLGFASVLVPFAFSIAGLWYKKYTEWIKPALPWTFFGIGVLGLGILMGGAWAYEALSFGGFWAWDPVENAVLVPWLTLVAAGHLMLIYKARKTNLKTTYALVFISFILILYSTFLTRSGVLGDSSVHSFVDLGLNGQLLLYLFFFIGLSLFLFFYRYKNLPKSSGEEKFWSREFFMFIGALVLTISSFQVTFSTSIPVLNSLNVVEFINPIRGWFSMEPLENIAPPIDPIDHYNSWQLPFALVITFLIGITQFMKYKNNDTAELVKKILLSLIISVVLTGLIAWGSQMDNRLYILMLFTSLFAIIGNGDYWLRMVKGKYNFAGSSIAHIGFGLIMLGALISNTNKEVISKNDTYIAEGFPANENILMELNDTLQMGRYNVVWNGESREGHHRKFHMDYYKQKSNGELEKVFELEPYIQMNETFGNVAEPSTKHFLTHDIYTHITYAEPDEVREKREANEGYGREADVEMSVNDTAVYAQHFIILDSLSIASELSRFDANGNPMSIAVKAHMRVVNVAGQAYPAEPIYFVEDAGVKHIDADIEDIQMRIRFEDVDSQTGKISLKAYQYVGDEEDFIVMKAIIFPYINLLWLGSILMVIGTVLAIRHRIRKSA